MAIAAVPDYVGKDFSGASPGLRFGMYLPVWNAGGWSRIESKVDDLRPVVALNPEHKALMAALRQRQHATAARIEPSQVLITEAVAVAPFTTGLGNEHPLENGFAFLNPYGLPYLAGSGVKGVLRKAASELADGLFGGTEGWTSASIEALFGSTNNNDDSGQRGALIVWDVLPEIAGDALRIEVMTAHQSHYLQSGSSPHESGQPNPINFLAVPPRSHFDFIIQCDLPFLKRIAPDLAEGERWKTLLQAALTHAFDWLGFGAKTAVGYGAMRSLTQDEIAAARAEARKSAWVEEQIAALVAKNRSNPDEILRSKALAEAWNAIPDPKVKAAAKSDIERRWQAKGWWDSPPGKAAKQAKAAYSSE